MYVTSINKLILLDFTCSLILESKWHEIIVLIEKDMKRKIQLKTISNIDNSRK